MATIPVLPLVDAVLLPGMVIPVTLDAGTGRVIQLGGAAASVFAADPKIAEVRPASATSLFVFAVYVALLSAIVLLVAAFPS